MIHTITREPHEVVFKLPAKSTGLNFFLEEKNKIYWEMTDENEKLMINLFTDIGTSFYPLILKNAWTFRTYFCTFNSIIKSLDPWLKFFYKENDQILTVTSMFSYFEGLLNFFHYIERNILKYKINLSDLYLNRIKPIFNTMITLGRH